MEKVALIHHSGQKFRGSEIHLEKSDTRDIEKFSVKENFRKILMVSHFYLEFSWNKNHDKITYSHRAFSNFLGLYRI